jgi:MFS family permease
MYLFRIPFFLLFFISQSFTFKVNTNPTFSLSLNDSTIVLDSVQKRTVQKNKLKQHKTILKVTSLISALLAVYNAVKPAENAWAMLFFGILSIGAFILSFVIKKPTDYSKDLDKEITIYKWKKYKSLNKSWFVTFFTGLFAMILTILSEFGLIQLSVLGSIFPIFILGLLAISFILGFFGKYESKRKMSKRFLLAVLGLFLPFLPIILLFSLYYFSNIGRD